jgi:hypothetical protein
MEQAKEKKTTSEKPGSLIPPDFKGALSALLKGISKLKEEKGRNVNKKPSD